MSRPTIPVCDQCGKAKGPSNRWFVGVEAQVPAYPHEHGPFSAFTVFPFKTGIEYENYKDLCGEACAQKALAQWMQKQKA